MAILYNKYVFVYTEHAKDKFKLKAHKKFKITTNKVQNAIQKGLVIEIEADVTSIVGELDENHSLYVVFKPEGENIKIITFFMATKGRYERKVLQGR